MTMHQVIKMKKWANELNRAFSKKYKWPKILTIPGHKGKANKKHTKIHFTPVRIAVIKCYQQRMFSEDLGPWKNPSRTRGWGEVE
jgi:hypothetical protein